MNQEPTDQQTDTSPIDFPPVNNSQPVTIRHPLILGCIGLILLLSIFMLGMGVGYGAGKWGADGAPPFQAGIDVLPRSNRAMDETEHGAESELYPEMDIFWEAMDLLYRDYYGELPESEDTVYGAVRGVLGLLDDPNTSFLTPEDAEYFRTNLAGSFEGIGARVGWDEEVDTLIITEPFENQPAWEAGLRRDDLILAVDGESLIGTSVNDAVQKIRGPEGTTVTLTVQRVGLNAPFDVEVVRKRIEIPTIRTDVVGPADDIAYIRLNSFNENAGQLVREATRNALQREPSALIFDLRGNTGGLLREAVSVASVFMEDQDVLIERFSNGTSETYATEGNAVAGKLPVVVLVNGGSASASEIVAGGPYRTGRATLIGTTTYGKGSVQLPHTLSNGAILRVTIARWFTPLDRTIEGVGLEPDIVVDMPATATGVETDATQDAQLDAAIEYLLGSE